MLLAFITVSLLTSISFQPCLSNPTPETNLLLSLLQHFQSYGVLLIQTNEVSTQKLLRTQKILNSKFRYFTSIVSAYEIEEMLSADVEHGSQKIMVVSYLCEEMLQSLQQLSAAADISRFTWLTFSTDVNSTSDKLSHLPIPFNCEFIVAEETNSGQFQLLEMYTVKSTSRMSTVRFGSWSRPQGLLISTSDFYNRRSDLNGTSLSVAVQEVQSFQRGARTIMVCIHEILWMSMAKRMNIQTEYVAHGLELPEGIILANGTATGLIATVNKTGGADASIAVFGMRAEKLKTHTFFRPTLRSTIEVFTRYLSGQEIGWQTYVVPFNNNIWASVVAWITFSGIFMLGMLRLSTHIPQQRSMYEYLWVPFYAFCCQGNSETPKKTSHRMTFLLFFIAPGILVPAYSAALTSFLTLQKARVPFTDLEGFIQDGSYKIGGISSFYDFFLLDPSNPFTTRMNEKNLVEMENRPTSEVEGVKRMCSQKFSLIDVIYSVYALKPKCRYFKLNKPFYVDYSSMVMTKNSPYKEMFDRYLDVLWETGVVQQTKFRVCVANNLIMFLDFDKEFVEFVAIVLENTVLIFAILVFGAIAALITLCIEICYFNMNELKMSK